MRVLSKHSCGPLPLTRPRVATDSESVCLPDCNLKLFLGQKQTKIVRGDDLRL